MSKIEDLFEDGELEHVIPNAIRVELGKYQDEVYIKAYVSELSSMHEYNGYRVKQILEQPSSSSDDETQPDRNDDFSSEEEEVKETIPKEEETKTDICPPIEVTSVVTELKEEIQEQQKEIVPKSCSAGHILTFLFVSTLFFTAGVLSAKLY